MSPEPEGSDPETGRRSRRTRGGFTLVEVVVATVVLGIVLIFVLGGLLYGMKEGTRGQARAGAAAWADAELDYLRSQGFSGLADDVAAGARTLTRTAGYTTYGGLAEPRIPAGFDRAEIVVTNVAGLPLRKLTVRLYETSTASAYVIISSHVAQVTAP